MEKDLRDIAEQDFISEQKATGFLANSYPTLTADNFRRTRSV